MSALTISIAGVISFTTGNETAFGRDRQVARAFHIAEAGLNDGIAVIGNTDAQNVKATGTSLPSGAPGTNYSNTYSLSLDSGTGHYWMTKYAAGDSNCTAADSSSTEPCWVVTAVATSPNGKITKKLQETVTWVENDQEEPGVFDYSLFVDNEGGSCVDTNGSSTLVLTKVWIGGDFCPAGGETIVPQANHTGSVYIGGQYQGRNNTSIGSPSAYYSRTNVVHGCYVQNNPEPCDVPSASYVYSDSTPAAQPSDLEKPTIDAASVYTTTDWHNAGSAANCTTGSFTFDSDTTPGNGTTPTTTLMPSGSDFDCTVKDRSGDYVGRLAWNSTTKQLTIDGTIFIDGGVTLSNSGTYTGNGTIWVNGIVDGPNGNITICGPESGTTPLVSPGGCPGTWDPYQGELGLVVVNPTNSATAFDRQGNGEIDMTVLINQGYADTGGTVIAGPVIADSATIGGSSGLVVPSSPPRNFPSTVTLQAAWVVQKGSWKQLQ